MYKCRLQPRDKQIIDFLATQGFATREQLRREFFCSFQTSNDRLTRLEVNGYIRGKRVTAFFPERSHLYDSHLKSLRVRSDTTIFQLAPSYRRLYPRNAALVRRCMLVHQLLLNEARLSLQERFPDAVFMNEQQVRLLGRDFINHNPEFTPDLVMKSKNVLMAIELERVIKSKNRYATKFRLYEDSLYTHILYLFTDGDSLKRLLRLVGYDPRFAFGNYSDLETVTTKRFSNMSFNNWIDLISRGEEK